MLGICGFKKGVGGQGINGGTSVRLGMGMRGQVSGQEGNLWDKCPVRHGDGRYKGRVEKCLVWLGICGFKKEFAGRVSMVGQVSGQAWGWEDKCPVRKEIQGTSVRLGMGMGGQVSGSEGNLGRGIQGGQKSGLVELYIIELTYILQEFDGKVKGEMVVQDVVEI